MSQRAVSSLVRWSSTGEFQCVCQIAHRRTAVRLQRLVALGEARQHRQLEAPGDEAQDRRRVVLRVIDEAFAWRTARR